MRFLYILHCWAAKLVQYSKTCLMRPLKNRQNKRLNDKWASTRENLSSVGCEQQRRRPACASGQSDQCLCNSLIGKYHI